MKLFLEGGRRHNFCDHTQIITIKDGTDRCEDTDQKLERPITSAWIPIKSASTVITPCTFLLTWYHLGGSAIFQ